MRVIGDAFAALAACLLIQSTVVLATGCHPHHSVTVIVWTTITAAAMFALAAGKACTGRTLGNPVLRTEGRVTLMDGILATAVLLDLVLNAALDSRLSSAWYCSWRRHFSGPVARAHHERTG